VQFLFYAKNQTINYGYIQFEVYSNDTRHIFAFGYGSYYGWQYVADFPVDYSQYVSFIVDSNLGFVMDGHEHPGYPYVETIHFARPEVPDAPNRPSVFNMGYNSAQVSWIDGYDGGATILETQIGYGTDPNSPQFTVGNASQGQYIGNLATGTVYYFWARHRNYQGWGAWSLPSWGRTYLGAFVKEGGVWKLAIPYVRESGIWKKAEPVVNHN
jgi:predicted enzyme related to lactoylglutathione lyase